MKEIFFNACFLGLLLCMGLTHAHATVEFNEGILDVEFDAKNINGTVWSVVEQTDGKIVVGGNFTDVAGVSRSNITRFNKDGTLDSSFLATSVNNVVYTVVQQSDGKILIGGGFTQVGEKKRNRIARLNVDGSLDDAFDPNANSTIYKIAQQTDGKLIIGGSFNRVANSDRSRIAKLQLDGQIDDAFDTSDIGLDGSVFSFAQQGGNKIIIGGSFSAGKDFSGRIIRLSEDGSRDASFKPIEAGHSSIRNLVSDSNGAIFFSATKAKNTEPFIRKLNFNGATDIGFNSVFLARNGVVNSIALLKSGKLLLGGSFDGAKQSSLIRINANGFLDVDFKPNVDGAVLDIFRQSNGRILIGGKFSNVNSMRRNNIARFLPADSTIDLQVSQESAEAINLEWTAIEGAEIYKIYQCSIDRTSCAQSFFTTENNYRDQNVLRGKEYYYTIYACDANKDHCLKVSDTQVGRVGKADGYEPNNNANEAKQISRSGSQIHSFHEASDEDWFTLVLRKPQKIIISTGPFGSSKHSDTVLKLFDSVSGELVAENDNGGAEFAGYSKIETTLSEGVYNLQAYQFKNVIRLLYKPVENYILNIEMGEVMVDSSKVFE